MEECLQAYRLRKERPFEFMQGDDARSRRADTMLLLYLRRNLGAWPASRKREAGTCSSRASASQQQFACSDEACIAARQPDQSSCWAFAKTQTRAERTRVKRISSSRALSNHAAKRPAPGLDSPSKDRRVFQSLSGPARPSGVRLVGLVPCNTLPGFAPSVLRFHLPLSWGCTVKKSRPVQPWPCSAIKQTLLHAAKDSEKQ